MTKDRIKKILIVVGIVALVAMAFQYLGGTSDTGTLSASNTADSVDAKYINTLLQKMAQVKLDRSLFSDPVFQNLKDNTVIFSSQPAGRNNPFAPIGSDGQTTATSSKKN
ncbi:MAG: hypothetical protein WCX27_01830 [Candidatus Paceibacterota bacterium]|jgi:hypothetical protein